MAFRKDNDGLTQVVSMLVGGAIFMVAVGAVLMAAQHTNRDSASADASRQVIATDSLADLLVYSPGVGWAAGPDAIARLGLGAANGSGLDPASLEALRGAFFDSTANGKVDYADARASLGLAPGQEFHIRVYPIGMDLIYQSSLIGLDVAYIGDWLSLSSVKTALGTPTSQLAAAANAELNKTMAANTANERLILRQAGLNFNDRVYITSASPSVLVDLPAPLIDPPLLTYLGVPLLEGDVYPDIKAYLDANLPGRLARYDLIVIGSGVDHSSMTSNAVKNGFRDWVLDGGTLVVLGSSSQNVQWLQPLFSVGVATANGAPTAPDVSHPILKEPHQLDWTHYDNKGLTWDIKDTGSNAHYDDFIHVIQQGGKDVLAVSKEGTFGTGRIILTTYQPRDIAATLGQLEAIHFFENIALYADRANLYLEYGPTAPQEAAVSVAVRQSWIWDPQLGQVPVRIEVQTWG